MSPPGQSPPGPRAVRQLLWQNNPIAGTPYAPSAADGYDAAHRWRWRSAISWSFRTCWCCRLQRRPGARRARQKPKWPVDRQPAAVAPDAPAAVANPPLLLPTGKITPGSRARTLPLRPSPSSRFGRWIVPGSHVSPMPPAARLTSLRSRSAFSSSLRHQRNLHAPDASRV